MAAAWPVLAAICALSDTDQEAVELQAIDRVHRFGQDKPVEIIRFVVDDSIEDKMIRASLLMPCSAHCCSAAAAQDCARRGVGAQAHIASADRAQRPRRQHDDQGALINAVYMLTRSQENFESASIGCGDFADSILSRLRFNDRLNLPVQRVHACACSSPRYSHSSRARLDRSNSTRSTQDAPHGLSPLLGGPWGSRFARSQPLISIWP